MSLFDPGSEILTVEYKINFLAPARGVMLIAEGRLLRAGRMISVTAVEVRAVEEDGDRLCAVLQQTCMPG
jgi:acyl-coenzyme A thioesterase PaaI-like protein